MKRTYKYDAASGKMVEVWNNGYKLQGSAYIQPDIQPFQSTIDGTIISSRAGLARHMRTHDVVNPDDYKEHRKKMATEREARLNGTHPEIRADRIRTVSDAYERVRNQKLADGTWKGRL